MLREPRFEEVRLEARAERAEPRVRPVEVREEERVETDEAVRAEVSRAPDGADEPFPPVFAASPQVSQYPSTTVPPQFGRLQARAAGALARAGADPPEGAADAFGAGPDRAARPQVSQ